METNALVKILPLTYRYTARSTPVLNGIGLTVSEGSLFGLLGPNGAGKTTLLSLLTGLLPCAPGQIYLNGQDVTGNTARQSVGLSLVPQDFAFYGPLTVRENLSFFAGVQGLKGNEVSQRVKDCARRTGILDRMGDRAGRLSGGLKRRLNLAIGLLCEPRLLLLDEPTVGIDPHSRHFILETIRELNRQGTTIIYTSHYMDEIEELCDRVGIMDHGRMFREGLTGDLLQEGGGSLETLFLDLTKRQLRD